MSTYNTKVSGIYTPTKNPTVGKISIIFDRTKKDGTTYQVKRRVLAFFDGMPDCNDGDIIIVEGQLDAIAERDVNGSIKYFERKSGETDVSIGYILYGAVLRDVKPGAPKPAEKVIDLDDAAKYNTAPF